MAGVLLTMTRAELGSFRDRLVKLKNDTAILIEELEAHTKLEESEGDDPLANLVAAHVCLRDAYQDFSADSDYFEIVEADAKASLAASLNDLGIEVVAGKVRKSDIKKVLAEKANPITAKEFLKEFEEWSGGYTPDEVPLEAFWYKCKELGVPFELAKRLVEQFGLYAFSRQEFTEEEYADECTKRKLSSFKFDL